MKKGTNERIHTKGAVCLDVKIGDYVYMDYVGASFDCREMCLGKATHESWNIPWNEIPFMKDSSITKYKTYQINEDEYLKTAKERIAFLANAFPDRAYEILNTMPKKYKKMSIQDFKDVRDKIIFPLWMKHEILLRDGLGSFGVEVNIVEGGLVPMEIQVPDRFREKNSNVLER